MGLDKIEQRVELEKGEEKISVECVGNRKLGEGEISKHIKIQKDVRSYLDQALPASYFLVYEGDNGAVIMTHGTKAPSHNIGMLYGATCETGKMIAKGEMR